MALDEFERRLYSDVVSVVNRANKSVEFMFDSKLYCFKPGEKKFLPRFIVMHGIEKLPVRVDSQSTVVLESFLGIEGDENWPVAPLNKNPEEIRDEPKMELGENVLVPQGAKIKKQSLPGFKESFAPNNQGNSGDYRSQ